MKVMKFGGTSVGTADNIEKVISSVPRAAAGGPCAVVLSAMQGTTDETHRSRDEWRNAATTGSIEIISEIGDRHTEAVRRVCFHGHRTATRHHWSSLKPTSHEIESLCEGVTLCVRLNCPQDARPDFGFGELLSLANCLRGIEAERPR